MAYSDKQHGRDHLLKDLVKLHQSLAGDEPAAGLPEAVAEPDPEVTAPRSDLFVEHFPMGVLFAEVVRDRYRHPVEYRVHSVNRRYAELIGVERVSVLETPFFDVLPGGREDWASVIGDVALKGRVAQGVSQSPDGARSLRVLLFLPRRDTLAVVLEDPVGDNAALLGSALQRFRQEEQILESVSLLICRFLPGGKLTYANAAYRRFFNADTESLIGHCYHPAVAAESRDFVRSRMEMICRDLPAVTYECPLDLEAGRRWVRWTDSGVFDENGTLAAYQSAGVDITAEKAVAEREQRVGGLLRDLLAYQVRRRKEFEGNQSASAKDLRTLAEENRKLRQDVKRLEELTIRGALQVCRRCSRIHDEEGHWMLPNLYLELHTAAKVGHSLCPYCRDKSGADMEKKLGRG